MADILSHPTKATPPVAIARPPGIHRIVLSNPPANALSMATMAALIEALAAAAEDPACRVVVIAATGPVFSAGHDLKELTAHRGDADGGE
ncbi:MAG: enoyl-CoA hydratase, partial [Sphingomonadales bacterium]